MPDAPDRRIVKPASPTATIPNPGHGRKLPPDGIEVTWSAYWQRMLNRKEIVVVSADPAPASPAGAPAGTPTSAAPAAPAGSTGAPAKG